MNKKFLKISQKILKGLLPLINEKYILKKHPDSGKVRALLVDEELSYTKKFSDREKISL